MLLHVALVGAVLAGSSAAPKDVLNVSGSIPAESLTVGESYELHLEWVLKEGWSATDSGIPKPILQIEVPDSVKLAGQVLTEHRELAANEFLQEPFERLLDSNPASIKFELTKEPGDQDAIEFSVLAYVTDKPGEDGWFLRQRYTIPVTANAAAVASDPENSQWGQGGVLQIGDEAPSFELPRADGSMFSLDDHLFNSNIIVTTYRAFW